VAIAASACAQDGNKDSGAAIGALVAVLLIVPLQFAIALLFPAFTRRTQRAIAAEFWPCAGWGALIVVLAIIVGAIFSWAGKGGQGVAIAVGVVTALLAIAGGVGLSRCIGDWAFRRWDETVPGPLSVLAGSVLWCLGGVIPVVGWTAAVFSLFASLGAAVLSLLHSAAGDGRASRRSDAPSAPSTTPLEKLSVIIPVYNEESTVREVIERVKALALPKEIIVVDDGSTDGTQGILREEGEDDIVRVYTSPTNFGKGAAIRIGLSFATGNVVLIQDADLELCPEEYPRLLEPILSGRTNVVYGSRFLHASRGIPWRTRVANRWLARWCNLLYRSRLTDVSTAYKVFRTEAIQRVTLRSVGFEFCAEVTALLLRGRERIEEVPVGYHPRTRAQGKKLNYLTDGARAAWCLLRLRFASPPEPELPAQ